MTQEPKTCATPLLVYSDSWISNSTFHQLANFRNSINWELHFSGNEFLAGITFAGGSGRISFKWFKKVDTLVDVSGMRVFFEPLDLRRFRGAFRCRGTEFEKNLNVSDAELAEADFSGAICRGDLDLSRSVFADAPCFRKAILDDSVDLTGIDVLGTA